MLQINPIDVCDWSRDSEFSEAYPEGARPKRIVISPHSPDQIFIKRDWQYLFKRSAGRYPEQFWTEVIAYQIGLMLNVPVPPAFAAFDSMTGECGALSEWFYQQDENVFYSAGHFFYKEIPRFDKKKGTEHNLLTAQKINNQLIGDSHIYDFWSMLLFDTLIGNTDRHQDNWGYIIDSIRLPKSVARRKKAPFEFRRRFAPWFDNGTSLGHELFENKFVWNDEALDRYIHRGQHHFRFAMDNLVRVKHIESLEFIAKHNGRVRALLIRKLKAFDVDELSSVLDRLVEIPMPESGMLSRERADFILRLTKRRATIALETLNGNG